MTNLSSQMTGRVDLGELRALFGVDDGLLPDINFNFNGAGVVAAAYDRIQRHAKGLGAGACYWSNTRRTIRPIEFGDNPAEQLIKGEAEAFRVVFHGMRSAKGQPIPDLGIFVLAPDCLALDYRPGYEWSGAAIAAMLDLMTEIASLAPNTIVTHDGNLMDPEGEILLSVFNQWRTRKAAEQ
jgi:hypothetical protein